MAKIHPTSVVSEGAVLADGVEVGPFCFVGPNVTIGEGTRLIGHCNIDGYTTIGANNVIHPFASLGQPAQDHAVEAGAATYLRVGDNNIFRGARRREDESRTGFRPQGRDHCPYRDGKARFRDGLA